MTQPGGENPPSTSAHATAPTPAASSAAPASGDAPASAPPDPLTPLPALLVPLSAEQTLAALETLARRGKLPGFHARGSSADAAAPLFVIDAFGAPFDGVLSAQVPQTPAPNATLRLEFTVKLKPLWPAVFVLSLLLAIWPGVVLTESLLASFFPHTAWTWQYTWWWYMPLSILGTPFAIKQAFSTSRLAARASAHESVAQLASGLGATLV